MDFNFDKRRKYRIAFWFFIILLSLLMGILNAIYEFDNKIIFVYLVFIAIFTFTLYYLWYKKFSIHIKESMFLLESGDNKGFIDETNRIFEGVKSPNLKIMKDINLSCAYYNMGSYNEAKSILSNIDKDALQISPYEKTFFINQTLIAFMLRDNDEALSIIDEYPNLLNLTKKDIKNSFNIESAVEDIKILSKNAKGNKAEAFRLLEEAKSKSDTTMETANLDRIEKLLRRP